MNEGISTVKAVNFEKSWTSQYGEMNTYKYELDNGLVLSANHKAGNDPRAVGTEVTFKVTKENQYGKSGKIGIPQEGQGQPLGAPAPANRPAPAGRPAPAPSKDKNASFALSYAKDLFAPVSDRYPDPNDLADAVLLVAERFNVWLQNN